MPSTQDRGGEDRASAQLGPAAVGLASFDELETICFTWSFNLNVDLTQNALAEAPRAMSDHTPGRSVV